ncbi:MAG: hypothetical protein K2Q12_06190 [Rickettsiales bacterium]|nr:hypothetical protein [Rickettsiales bacterium]
MPDSSSRPPIDDRAARREEMLGGLSGLSVPYARDRETILELLLPERFPASADSGNYSDVSNSYVSGIAALQQVFSPAGVGKFVRPRENTWIRHELAVIGAGLDFNTKRYEFDQILAHFANLPKAFDASDRRYEQYADLRMNLAVMRNFLLNHFFPDGDVENDTKDREAAHSLNQIAMHIGQMLHRGQSWVPNLGPSVSLSRAGEKGDGAAAIYEKLRHGQTVRNLLSPVLVPLNFVRNRSNMHWRLPPLHETPFDPRNLNAPLDTVSTGGDVDSTNGGRPDAQGVLPDRERWNVVSHSFDDIGAGLAGAVVPFSAVDHLSQAVKDRAIELAREILEKLKLKFSDVPLEELIDRVDTSEVYKLLSETQKLSELFYTQAARATQHDDAIFYDKEIQTAFEALGKLSVQAKLQALKYAEESGSSENAMAIAKQIESMPAGWRKTGDVTVGQLLGSVHIGLEKILQRLHEQSQTTTETRQLGLAAPAMNQGASEVLSSGQGRTVQQASMAPSGSTIPPIQQRMQQVQAANEITALAANRRSLQENSSFMSGTTGTAPSASALMTATPPPRPRTTRSRTAGAGNAVREAAARGASPQMALAPSPAAPAFGALLNAGLNAGDLASMRGSLAQTGLSGPAVGPRTAAGTVRSLAAAKQQPEANQADLPPTTRPNNGLTGR